MNIYNSEPHIRFLEEGFIFDEEDNIWSKNKDNSFFTASIDNDGKFVAVMTNDDADYDEICADTFDEIIEWMNNK